jgi:hypothetical protein
MKTADKNWKSTKSSAWTKFRTDVKACKATSVPHDMDKSGSEVADH